MDFEELKMQFAQMNRCWKLYKKYALQKYDENMFNSFNMEYGRLLSYLQDSPIKHIAKGVGRAIDQVWTEQEKEDKQNES